MKTAKANRLLLSARWLLTALALLPFITGAAQNSQPGKSTDDKFPQNLPATARFEVNSSALEKIFQSDQNVNIALSASFQLKGNVENKEVDKNGDGTMLIRTDGMDGAMLSIARFTGDDLSVHYSGHLLKLHASEGMLLVEKDHSYYFIRTQQHYLLAE